LEKFSPSLKWQIDTLIKMLCLAGNFVSEDTISSVINLVISTPDLHLYSVHKLFIAMKSNLGQEGIVKVGIYVLGEMGDILTKNSVSGPDNENISVTEDEVIELIDEINNRRYSHGVKEYLVNCYIKLTSKFSEKNANYLRTLLENETKSYHCEVQQRAVEYVVFSNLANYNQKKDILRSIPNSKIIRESEVKKYFIY
jgi:AP-1 complex subunit gamma-1